MSLISAVQSYLEDYTGLPANAPVWVNYLSTMPVSYGIVPLPGQRTVEAYLDGSSLREFPFAFQVMASTADDAARLGNIAFGETFAEWLDEQTNDDDLPTLDTGKTAYSIEATQWGFLFEQGDSETAVYQISCRLLFEQVA